MLAQSFLIATLIALLANGIIFSIYWYVHRTRIQGSFCVMVFSYLLVGLIELQLLKSSGIMQQLIFQLMIICNVALSNFLTTVSKICWPWKKYLMSFLVLIGMAHISNIAIHKIIGDVITGVACSYPLIDSGIRVLLKNKKKIISIKILSMCALIFGIITLLYPIVVNLQLFQIPLMIALITIVCITIAGGQAISEISELEKLDIFSKLDESRKISTAIRLNDLARLSNALREQIIPPITAIAKELDTLMLAYTESGSRKDHLNLVKQGIDDVLRNIDKFQGLRGEAPQIIETNLTIDQLMMKAFDQFQDKYPYVDVAFPLQTDITKTVKDKTGLLPTAISSLLENAWEAKVDDNETSINCEMDHKDDMVIIRIVDYGPGISEDIENKIFSPFFTTKASTKHLGVGLSVARSIIEANEGKVTVERRSSPTIIMVELKEVLTERKFVKDTKKLSKV